MEWAEFIADAPEERIMGGRIRQRHRVPTQFFPLALLHFRTQRSSKQLASKTNPEYRLFELKRGFNQVHLISKKGVPGIFVDPHGPAHDDQARFLSHLCRYWIPLMRFDV